MLQWNEVLQSRPRVYDRGDHWYCVGRSRWLRDLRSQREQDERIQDRQGDLFFCPYRPRLDDRYALRQLYSGNPQGRGAQRSCLGRKCGCHHASTFQHRVGDKPGVAARHERWAGPERSAGHEDVGTRIRERLGTAHLGCFQDAAWCAAGCCSAAGGGSIICHECTKAASVMTMSLGYFRELFETRGKLEILGARWEDSN